jgi:hypothetical protein
MSAPARLPDGTFYGRGELDRCAQRLRRERPRLTLERLAERVAYVEADVDAVRAVLGDQVAELPELAEHVLDTLDVVLPVLLDLQRRVEVLERREQGAP